MKKRIWIAGLLVVLALLGGWWVWRSSGVDPMPPPTDEAPSAAEIVATKQAARRYASSERGPATASGRITRAGDGRSVVGALVLLASKAGPGGAMQTPGERGGPLVTRTDAAGEFRFEGIPPGAYALSGSAPGLLPGRLQGVAVAPNAAVQGLDMALAAGGHRIAGNVEDLVGGQVPGARVAALRLDEGNVMAAYARAPLATMADDEGAYALWLPDGGYVLTATHPDYVDAHAQFRVDGGPRTRNIVMTPGAAIEGIVKTRAGEVVADAMVRWTDMSDLMRNGATAGNPAMGMAATERVQADAEGRFRITRLEPGLRSLTASARGFATAQPVEVPLGVAEEVTGVELIVDEALSISGFVVAEGEQDRGLAGVMIAAWSMSPAVNYAATAPSEDDGYFEIHGVVPGTYFMAATTEAALPSFMGKSVTVRDADVDDVLLTLQTGLHVRGRVDPAAEASVTVEINMASIGVMDMMRVISNGFVRGRADGEGSFDLFPVAGGTKISLVATADDGRKGRVELELGSADIDDVRVPLSPRARLAGRVISADGQPVEGVEVQLVPEVAAGPGMSMSFSPGGVLPGAQVGTTDEQGHYSVRGLEAGTYRARVNQAQGPALAWAEPVDPQQPTAAVELIIGEGEQRDGHDFRVEARDGVITGIVVGPQGAPLADAWVRVAREQSSGEYAAQLSEQIKQFQGGEIKQAKPSQELEPQDPAVTRALLGRFAEDPVLTDAAGKFEVGGLRAGTYLVVADGPRGTGRGQASAVVLGSSVTVTVEALAAVEGVVSSGGKPVDAYTISLRGPEIRSRRISDPTGRYTLDRLGPGKYRVEVEAADGSGSAEVEIEAAQTLELDLELEAFATVRGRLVDARSGEGIGGAKVMALGRAADPAGLLSMFGGGGPTTEDDGSFSVDRIRPGEGNIMFLDPDGEGFEALANASYDAEAGADKDLGTITGVAIGEVPTGERGKLGCSLEVATFAKRPRSPDAEDAEDDEADDDPTERLWVRSVTVGGPAEAVGVEPGDEIVAVRTVGVAGMGAAAAKISLGASHVRVGDDVTLKVARDGTERSVTIRAVARER